MSPAGPMQDYVSDEELKRKFVFTSCLGKGGFGEVYRATMISSGGVQSEVAIKILNTAMEPDSQAVARLQDEGRLLGALRHPSILHAHDLVNLGGHVGLVTEYIDGADLDVCIAQGLPVRAAVEATALIADALDAAFNAPSPDGSGPLQLIHRDIKPSNIRVGRHGSVKLLDFGIARAAHIERESKTETGRVIGSMLYLAPERLRGIDNLAASDIFSLGATLFESLTGERLFHETSMESRVGFAFNEEAFVGFLEERLRTLPKGVPEPVRMLLTQALDYDVEDRPTAREMVQLCEAIVDEMSGKTLRTWCRGHEWPTPSESSGSWTGRAITESDFEHISGTLSQDAIFSALDTHTLDRPSILTGTTQRQARSRRWTLLVLLLLLAIPLVIAVFSGAAVSTLYALGFREPAATGGPASTAAAAGSTTAAGGSASPPVDASSATAAMGTADAAHEARAAGADGATNAEPSETSTAQASTAAEETNTSQASTAAEETNTAQASTAGEAGAASTRNSETSGQSRTTSQATVRPRRAATSHLATSGIVPVRLVRDNLSVQVGELPAGTYRVMAKFGDDWEPAQVEVLGATKNSLEIPGDKTVVLSCSRMRRACKAELK